MITKGSIVTVVRGKKVPLGTTGRVFWMGTGQYGERVGIDAGGVTHWTAIANVALAASPAAPVAPVAAPVAAATTVTVSAAAFEALVARVTLLETLLAARPDLLVTPAPVAVSEEQAALDALVDAEACDPEPPSEARFAFEGEAA